MRSVFFATTLSPSVTWKVTRYRPALVGVPLRMPSAGSKRTPLGSGPFQQSSTCAGGGHPSRRPSLDTGDRPCRAVARACSPRGARRRRSSRRSRPCDPRCRPVAEWRGRLPERAEFRRPSRPRRAPAPSAAIPQRACTCTSPLPPEGVSLPLNGTDVRRDGLDDAVLFHQGYDLGRRGRDHRLRCVHVVDVGGQRDVVAAIGRDIVGHVGADRPDRRGTGLLAAQPALDVDNSVGHDHLRHANPSPFGGSLATLPTAAQSKLREEAAGYASRMSMRSVFFATTLRPSVTWKVTR